MMLLEAVLVLMHMISLGRHPGNVFLWEALQLETTISLGTFLITKDSLNVLTNMSLVRYADASDFKTF